MDSDDVSRQWGIVARLDVVDWQMHDGEHPATTDPEADTWARRWHTMLLVLTGVMIADGAVMFLGPAIHDRLALAAALAVFPLGGLAVVAAARHRHFRRITGVPVIAPVRSPLEAVAALCAFNRAQGDEIRHIAATLDDDDPRRSKALRAAAEPDRASRRFARHVIALCELAARADARRRRRARDRNIRRIWRLCLPILDHLTTAYDNLEQDEQAPTERGYDEPSRSDR